MGERESRLLNEPFLSSLSRRRPKVILKAAISLDGKIATVSGMSKWITGEKARDKVHEIRAGADAILVGKGTVRMDDPSLTVRLPGFVRQDGWPMRVILDSHLTIPPNSKIFRGKAKTIIFTSFKAPPEREKGFLQKGARVFRVPSSQKMLSLRAVLKVLHSLQVRTLLVEGGGIVHASFLREKLADEAVLFISPKVLGGPAPSWVGGEGTKDLKRVPFLGNIQTQWVGDDLLLKGDFNY
jgi:diaminohydroxyphosphoribosylaminopyrimidine deaminase/5-amino-6-(5-phosphoribosylamino)uracil reductase